jgi:hypothetical protein
VDNGLVHRFVHGLVQHMECWTAQETTHTCTKPKMQQQSN